MTNLRYATKITDSEIGEDLSEDLRREKVDVWKIMLRGSVGFRRRMQARSVRQMI